MNHFTIDGNNCRCCGICAAICPAHLISGGQDTLPAAVAEAGRLCINCGHCVAVCPQGALALNTMAPEACPPVQNGILPAPAQIEHFLACRRSIRTYTTKPVPRETLARLIAAANYAPSGHNRQMTSWLVITEKNEVSRLAALVVDWLRQMLTEDPQKAPVYLSRIVAAWDRGEDRICRGAPHIIVAHAPESSLPPVSTDCTIALAYLELAAFAFGLGTCWAGYFNTAANLYPPLTRSLGLPAGHRSFGAMLIGYPKYQYYRIPLRKEPRIIWR